MWSDGFRPPLTNRKVKITMFQSQPVKSIDTLRADVCDAVEAAKTLYAKCVELGQGRPDVVSALLGVAIQYQTNEFDGDIAEFERQVRELLAETH